MREVTLAFLAIGLFVQDVSNNIWTDKDLIYLIVVGLYAVLVSILSKKTKFKKITFLMGIIQLLLLVGISVIYIILAPILTNMTAKITYTSVTILLILATLFTLLLLIRDGKKIYA